MQQAQKEKPKISVIVPYYQKQQGLLRRAIRSALDSKGNFELEIIIVDDGSPAPAEPELCALKSAGQLKIIKQQNRGVGAARNTGLEAATGDFIAFLDSDDEFRENHLQNALKALKQADFYFSDLEMDGKSFFESNGFFPVEKHGSAAMEQQGFCLFEKPFEKLLQFNPIGVPSVVFRKSILEKTRFEESITTGPDALFFTELFAKNPKVVFSKSTEIVCGKGVNIYRSIAGEPNANLAENRLRRWRLLSKKFGKKDKKTKELIEKGMLGFYKQLPWAIRKTGSLRLLVESLKSPWLFAVALISAVKEKQKFPMFEAVLLELQSDCNRDCWFCPRFGDRSGKRKNAQNKHVKKSLETKKVNELLGQLNELGFNGRIGFHELSEATLDKRLWGFAKKAKKLGMKTEIFTNGDILRRKKELRRKTAEVFDEVTVGLYDYKSDDEREREEAFWRNALWGSGVAFSPHEMRITRLGMDAERFGLASFKKMQQYARNKPCFAPYKRLLIHYNGEAALCCDDVLAEFGLGNVFEKSIEEIWWSKRHIEICRELAKGHRYKFNRCKECPVTMHMIRLRTKHWRLQRIERKIKTAGLHIKDLFEELNGAANNGKVSQ